MRLIVLALFFSLFITIGIGQIINPNIVESTILIDGQFDEWGAYPEYQDNRNESESNDIIKVANGNDSTMIYFHIEVNTEFDLFDNNTLVLYLDGDGNPQTGTSINNIGAEWKVDFSAKKIFELSDPEFSIKMSGVPVIALPTFTSNKFEIGISTTNLINGKKLIEGPQFGYSFLFDELRGDQVPADGEQLYRDFNKFNRNQSVKYNLEQQENTIRLITYNVLHDGLIKPERKNKFTSFLSATKPDIIGFNECWKTTEQQAKSLLDKSLPGSTWYVKKLDGNITCSKYEIVKSWDVLPKSRLLACLIQINSTTQALHINAHLSCCAKDDRRLEQAVALSEFIEKLKADSTITKQTAILISGDMNLVGLKQQYNVLKNGNNKLNGSDVDSTSLTDLLAYQTNGKSAITWRDGKSSYPPGRLDYIFYSDFNIEPKSAYILDCSLLSPKELKYFDGLNSKSSEISDHLPIIFDFSIK